MKLVTFSVLLGLTTVAAADEPDVARFTATARNLARKKLCKSVEQVAEQVSKLDANYYDTVFRVDPVIASCGDLPTSDNPVDPSHMEVPPPSSGSSTQAQRALPVHLTFDVEVGGGYGEYSSFNGGGDTDPAQVLNVGAGVGVFLSSTFVIGVRGLAAVASAQTFTYRPPSAGFEVPSGPNIPFNAKLSNEIGLLSTQVWIRNHVWVGGGFGCGRIDLAPNGRTTYGFASDVRVGVAAPYGFEASLEVTAISTTPTPALALDAQLGLAFVVGWQFL